MKHLSENLLLQFSIVSFTIMVLLALSISIVHYRRLDRNVGLLKDHGEAMMAGVMIKDSDPFSVPSLTRDIDHIRLITFGVVGGGFVVLYAGLVTIVWRGWRTIKAQQQSLESFNAELESRMRERTSQLQQANQELAGEIAERRQLQAQLIQADRLAAIGTLVAGVAHEVNNPLAGALGRADLMLRGSPDEALRSDLEVIRDEIQRAVRIMRNLLSFGREHKPEKSHTSINKALEDVLELRAYELRVKNVMVAKDLQRDLPEALVGPHQIQQVFLNLIVNSKQAMTEAQARGVLSVKTRREEETILIAIEDDGPGMPEEVLTKIFDPFFTTKSEGRGTGLGLSICYGIVQEHGGAIHVANEVGKGTTFTVELPDRTWTAT